MFHKISNLILQTKVRGICDFTSVSMTYVLCPTEEKLGMLMSSVIANVCMCGGLGEKVGVEVRQATEKGAVDPEHRTSTGRSSHSRTKGHHSKKEAFLYVC